MKTSVRNMVALVMSVLLAVLCTACSSGTSGKAEPEKTQAASAQEKADAGEKAAGGETAQEAAQEAAGPQKILIGYSLNKLDDAGNRQMIAFQKAIDQTNGERDDIEIEFTMTDAQSNVDQQISDVETLVAKGCDIIIVSCVDAKGSIPAVEYAKNNGVMTVEVRGMESDAIDLSFIGVDEYALSQMWVEYLEAKLEADPALVLNIGLVYGNAGQTLQLQRHQALKELAEANDRVNIVAENYCNWDTQMAMSTVEDWLQTYPEMNCIASASDEMCVGVTNALTAAGVDYDKWLVLSCDGTDTGIQNVKDGKTDIDIKQIYSRRFGLLLEMALEKYEGKLKDNYYNAGSLALVPLTLETFDEYATME